MNPLDEKSKKLFDYFFDFKQLSPKSYDKTTATPWTKIRAILVNGAEFESNWFLHQFARHTDDRELKSAIAIVRSQEQQQQKRISALKPIDENILETTIGYEQLAVELTAILAQMDCNSKNRSSLNFALLEDFDHLYRYSNLLLHDFGIKGENLVGHFTEIMPARPTISEHRFAKDNVKTALCNKTDDLLSILVANIITAAEQQTMNYYMNIAGFYPNEIGRKLYSEIALIEEEHVTQYESLKDPNCTWLENWVMHEYTECYLYFSMMNDETDSDIKKIYAEHYEMEVAHLKTAIYFLEKLENKAFASVIKSGEFPKLLKFGENKEYVRKVIEETVWLTGRDDGYVDTREIENCCDFCKFQEIINGNGQNTPSHIVIENQIKVSGKDYRFEIAPNPILDLQDRTKDSTTVGRGCKK